jgi:hypothetical protein
MSWDSNLAVAGGNGWGSSNPSFNNPMLRGNNNNSGGNNDGFDGNENKDSSRAQNDGRCFNCGEEGHSRADCTEPTKPRPCFNCGQEGYLYFLQA